MLQNRHIQLKAFITNQILVKALLFVGATAIISLFLPSATHKQLVYNEGDMWNYKTLVAPFDIAIEPDSDLIEAKKDSINKSFKAVYYIDSIGTQERMRKVKAKLAHLPYAESAKAYLAKELDYVFAKGILDDNTYTQVHNGSLSSLNIRNRGNSDSSMNPVEMFSTRTAYIYLDQQDNIPSRLIAELRLDTLLSPNIINDVETNSKLLNSLYRRCLPVNEIVSKGVVIVSSGDIVNSHTYRVLCAYEKLRQQQLQGEEYQMLCSLIGKIVIIIIMLSSVYVFLYHFRGDIFKDLRKVTFLISVITLFSCLAFRIIGQVEDGMYAVPFVMVPILIAVFFDSRTALYVHIHIILMCTMCTSQPNSFVFYQLVAGITAIVSLQEMTKRSQLLECAVLVFVAYCISYVTYRAVAYGNIDTVELGDYMALFGVNSVVLLFSYILVYVVERLFGFTSSVTLVELSNFNSPLLVQLGNKCPGTFQHSIQVSTLASDAAEKIRAKSLLVRVGALYHDIGKTLHPEFFTENQHKVEGFVSPYEGLTPQQSAEIIISHVKNGVEIAQREHLPNEIIAFIREHHGKGIAKYFYNTACNEAPNGEEVDPTPFRYPGPNPQSKETALLMMADAVEAASRSLTDYSESSLRALVNRIINAQIEDDFFDQSPLSFRDVIIIKESFVKRLAAFYHSRIAYPEKKK